MIKRTFNEKLQDSKHMPDIIEINDPKTVARYGGTHMLIAPPLAYDQAMREIPEGRVITSDRIRDFLAKRHGASFTCPLTAGLFISLAARASEERGEDETPYWRTLKKGGELNEKYPGGIEAQRKLLEAEGHTIITRGKRCFVKDYMDKLFELV